MIGNKALLLATAYKHTVTATATLAASGIQPLLDNVQGFDFGPWTAAVRPALLELGSHFSTVSTAASVDFYDELRSQFPPTDGLAYTASVLIDANKADKAYRNQIAYTFNTVQQTPNYDTVKSNVMATLSDFVTKSSFDNMTANAHKDASHVTISYLPSGKCCNFCRALIAQAHRGYWVKGDSAYGGSDWMASVFRRGSVFHPHCACTPIIQTDSMPSNAFNTPGQNTFNKDFHNVMSQAETLGVAYDNPSDLVVAMRIYQNSYDTTKNGTIVRTANWSRIVGPKRGATQDELLAMKNQLAGNGGKSFVVPAPTPAK